MLFAKESDAHVPAVNALLNWIKYSCTAEHLPTSFIKAQLNYFGKHMFEARIETDSLMSETGGWHFGWKSAKGVPEKPELVQL